MRLQRAFLRADGLFIVGFVLFQLVLSPTAGSFAYPPLGPGWWAAIGLLAAGVILAAFTGRLQGWNVARLARRGRLPPVDLGPTGPTLSGAAQVIGQMWKEWTALSLWLFLSVFLLLVALFSVGSALLKSSLLPTLAPGLASPLWQYSVVAALFAAACAVLYWGASTWGELRLIQPSIKTAESRFRELEWTFWHRY